jgi:tetratricopeptide (TPR) repeat protein
MSELSHGLVLLDQGRLEEAEACFVGVLMREPDNHFVHSRLALCRMQQPGRKNDALDSATTALGLDPQNDYYFALKSLILSDLHRHGEALAAADEAIAIDPEDSFNFSVKASALCGLRRWTEAEANCRTALAIDPDDSMASHLLTNVLRLQGRIEETQAAVDLQLSEDPESPFAHANAGWARLHQGRQRQAEEHFKEALRLDASMDSARSGLLESFKARSWYYRKYLSYCFFMQRFTGQKQMVIIIGAFIAYQVLRVPLRQIGAWAELLLIGAWVTLVLWIWLSPGIGNFLIYLDRTARLALHKKEVYHGLWIGLSLLIGIPLIACGVLLPFPAFTPLGVMSIASTVPAAMTFTNESRKGTLVFGSILALVLVMGVLCATLQYLSDGSSEFSKNLFLGIIITSALSTWLGNIPALHRDDSG